MNHNGIQFRLLLLGIVPSLILVSSLAFYFIQYHYLDLEDALKNKGQITINQLAISSIYGIFSANTEVLSGISTGLLNEPDIVSVQIFDNLGNILLKSEKKHSLAEEDLIHFQQPVIIHTINDALNESVITPFQIGQPTPTKTIGTVRLSLSLDHTKRQQQHYLRNSLLLTFTGIFFSIILAILLSRSISRPIINLTKIANKLAGGDMTVRAIDMGTFEIDALYQSFNSMAAGLQHTQTDLHHQVDIAVNELNLALAHLEKQNKSLEESSQLATSQNKAKSQFIAHISHEIRTPMNGVLGFIELLTKSELSSQQLEQTLLIKQSANYLLTIVNEILDYSSLQTGLFKINISSFNFREVIESCITSFLPPSNRVNLIIDVDNNVPQFISTDPIRLQQITANFLGNAIKFTHQGHIIIHCRLLDNNLFISISDTGIGIDANKLDTLFEPFLQRNPEAYNDKLGSGLGLPICKNIAIRLGGALGCCSATNIGSTFWLNLPISSIPPTSPPLYPHSFVVIDPYGLRKTAFLKQLSSLGFQALGLNTFSEFKQRQQKTHFDLIFYANDNNDAELITKQFELITATNILFLSTQKEAHSTVNTLSLPCCSRFLKTTIDNVFQPQLKQVTAPLPPEDLSQFSIFIADDNEINRLLLRSQLESYCKNITISVDGKEALSYLQKNEYDLIFLDLQMPFFNGQEIIEIIKRPGEINKNTPTIAITAHAQSNQRKTLIDAGFDECLIKPVLLEQLYEVLYLWLPKQSQYCINNTENIDYVTVLLEKTSGNHLLTSTLFNKLFIELPEQVQGIRQAANNSDIALATQITHKLHGSVSFCGFSDLQQIAQSLEHCLLNQDLALANIHITQLEDKIKDFLNLKASILSQVNDNK